MIKRIFMFLLISVYSNAQINIGIGINTQHYKYNLDGTNCDYDFNENNKLLVLGYSFEKKEVNRLSLMFFENSFYRRSEGITYSYIQNKNKKGFYGVYTLGLCTGYSKVEYLKSKSDSDRFYFENNMYLGNGISGIIGLGLGYALHKDISLETNLIGNAFVSSIIIKF